MRLFFMLPHNLRGHHRLTETTYMDEALLPIAGELLKVPPIPDGDEATAESIPLRATGTEPQQASAYIQQTGSPKGQKAARAGNTAGEGGRRTGHLTGNSQTLAAAWDGTERQRLSPGGNRRSAKAGDEIRTHDIHVGNLNTNAGYQAKNRVLDTVRPFISGPTLRPF